MWLGERLLEGRISICSKEMTCDQTLQDTAGLALPPSTQREREGGGEGGRQREREGGREGQGQRERERRRVGWKEGWKKRQEERGGEKRGRERGRRINRKRDGGDLTALAEMHFSPPE